MNAALLGIFFNAVSGKLMIVFPFDYFWKQLNYLNRSPDPSLCTYFVKNKELQIMFATFYFYDTHFFTYDMMCKIEFKKQEF